MKKLNWLTAAVYALVGYATPVLAQGSRSILSDKDRTIVNDQTDLRTGVVTIINYILTFLGLIAVGYIIYAGINMVTSAGNAEKIKAGQKTITYAVIGLLIVFMSFAIVNWIVAAPTGQTS